MRKFIEKLRSRITTADDIIVIGRYGNITPPGCGKVLALAPHPDDPEAVAVTLRWFADAGCTVHYTIATSGHSGVDDAWAYNKAAESGLELKDHDSLVAFKIECRKNEQIESARLAGFVTGEPLFMSVDEDENSRIIDNEYNLNLFVNILEELSPDIVILPHGNDTNHDHRVCFKLFREAVERLGRQGRPAPSAALFNRDPKTVEMRDRIVLPYDEVQAKWKAALLRAHLSQHERNLGQRGTGFDQRILDCDRETWSNLPDKQKKERYRGNSLHRCESFDIELFD